MADLPLIVGAGPVGLAGALFLARKNQPVRLIERLAERSIYSKALAVNPRTLELLEPTGVTERMLGIGKRITQAVVWGGGKPIAQIRVGDLPHRFPFMLALSQATSERLLEESLIESGGRIERGTELVSSRSLIGQAEATLRPSSGDDSAVVQAPWLFAADGARSTVRQSLKIDFRGSSFKTPWGLVDVPMDIDLAEDQANTIFLPGGGFLFVMRVYGDAPDTRGSSRPLWRVMGDVADPMQRLADVRKFSADAPVWTSSFHIAHRLAKTLQVDKICLGGDAAHIHSPAGARGMNLGIEDAWEFAQRITSGRLAGYGASRSKIDGAVVKRISMLTRMVQGESFIARAARSTVLPVISDIPSLRVKIMRTLTGTDHKLISG
ncbi:MAG: FAD-dependent monooxygenase [Phycisphaerae bacterium]|nr:FAD-dependent monooxygenase [Phycisphaerae bacterium]